MRKGGSEGGGYCGTELYSSVTARNMEHTGVEKVSFLTPFGIKHTGVEKSHFSLPLV